LKGTLTASEPFQTIAPLAAHLKLAAGIDDSLRKDELKELIVKVTGVDGAALIAWEHKNTTPLAKLLVPETVTVTDWPEDRFDMVWVFDRVGAHWHLIRCRNSCSRETAQSPLPESIRF
jgi:hypothetical protein